MQEYDAIGQEAFLSKYGFGKSTRYLLHHHGRTYDSKAIAAAAVGYQWGTPLKYTDFVGGKDTVQPKLRSMGFHVPDADVHFFVAGALYNRAADIHARFGGQKQGGISTPTSVPIVFLFTSAVGQRHGYDDFWDDDGRYHYYGEGQSGDMKMIAGNRAIAQHQEDGRHLFLFQPLGKSKPCRFLGEFRLVRWYEKEGVTDTSGASRKALVFVLDQVTSPDTPDQTLDAPTDDAATTATRQVVVRTKQRLFRDRVIKVERGCRVTDICDLRFLVASHIKPWSKCTDAERVDEANGLLLSPHIDHLFNDGWLTFLEDGQVKLSQALPDEVARALCGNLGATRRRSFNSRQLAFLRYHQENIFRRPGQPDELPTPEVA
jgi:hypothetical protein